MNILLFGMKCLVFFIMNYIDCRMTDLVFTLLVTGYCRPT